MMPRLHWNLDSPKGPLEGRRSVDFLTFGRRGYGRGENKHGVRVKNRKLRLVYLILSPGLAS